MTTRIITLSGTCKWAKLVDPDTKFAPPKWKITLYPDEKSLKVFNESGLKIKVKEDQDGTNITFSRPLSKIVSGKEVDFAPPTVVLRDGRPCDALVGNGSNVDIHVVVYSTALGMGHRLHKVVVNELNEYVPNSCLDPDLPPFEPDEPKEIKKGKK